MKKVILILLLALFLKTELNAQGISFIEGMTSWEAVLEKSRVMNKPVFVDVYTEWCGPCKWMDQNVFNQPQIGEYMNREFINIKLDAEKEWGPSFISKFGVSAYPTFLYFDPEGDMIFSTGGSKPVEQFLSSSKRAIVNWETGISTKTLNTLLNENKSPESLMSVLTQLGGNDPRVSHLLDTYLELLPNEELYTKETLELIVLNLNSTITTSSKAVSVLIQDYQSKPIHSNMLMSSWKYLTLLMQSSIDSAALQNNNNLYKDILDLVDTMYLQETFGKMFSSYYQARYHAIAHNQQEFVSCLEAYLDILLQKDTEEWIKLDYEDFAARLQLEGRTTDLGELKKEERDQLLRSHFSLIRISQEHLTNLTLLFKQSFPEVFTQYDHATLNRALRASSDRYARNQVLVSPIQVEASQTFINNYQQ